MAHTLNDYLTLLEREGLLAAPVPADLDREQPIALVSCDSRTVVPGTLFVCKGAHFKAEFLDMAQSRGAVAYASEKRWPDSPLPCILLSDLRRAMALMADLCYDHPSGKLKVIGFTGTARKPRFRALSHSDSKGYGPSISDLSVRSPRPGPRSRSGTAGPPR